MRIYSELDLNTFEAWSGAVNTLDRIRREGKCEELESILEENFNITGESYRLISNILDFVSNNATNENEQYNMLYNLLDGTIGLSDMELRKVYL